MKFWWKGVDIVANLTTGVGLALLALGSWRLQQRWRRKIDLRHEREDEMRRRLYLVQSLKAEQNDFWTQAATICSGHARDDNSQGFFHDRVRLFEKYLRWMEQNGLDVRADNWKRYNALKKWDLELQPTVLLRLPEEIRDTLLPDPNKDTAHRW
jgi:hypothetical protein